MAIPVLLLMALVLLLTAKSVTARREAAAIPAATASMTAGAKPRAVVFTDGEVDDQDSFIRLLMYSNDIDIEGLVITSSEWHYAGDGNGTRFSSEMGGAPATYGVRTSLRWTGTQWIYDLLDKYGEVQPNLLKHSPDFPSDSLLKSRVMIGNIKFEGEMSEDTEGSEYTKSLILDTTDSRPLYMLVWGGTNTLARALKSIEETYGPSAASDLTGSQAAVSGIKGSRAAVSGIKGSRNAEGSIDSTAARRERDPRLARMGWDSLKRYISSKVIIYAVLDQDATYRKYVSVSWPDIKIIYNSAQFAAFAYVWPRVTPDELQPYLGGEWFKKNIKFNHGPLLSSYFLWGDGHHIFGDEEDTFGDSTKLNDNQWGMMKQYDFISEGDSPSFFFLLQPGLMNLEDYSFGSLGGRFVQSATDPCRWEDGPSVTDLDPYTGKQESSFPQVRWIKALQEDFAARADWCVKDYGHANHAPILTLKVNAKIAAKPGSRVVLRASAKDPDGDKINYRWCQYAEAGSYPGKAILSGQQGLYDKAGAAYGKKVSLQVPSDAKPGQTIHVILEARDDCPVPMSTFSRVIIRIF